MNAPEILDRYQAMKSARSGHEQTWRSISKVLRPERQGIGGEQSTAGSRAHRQIYDSSGLMAVSNFKAGLYGTVTNPATQWFEVGILGADEEYQFGAGRDWLDDTTRRLRISFSPAMSGFYNQVLPVYADCGTLGSAVFFSREMIGRQMFHDECISIEECYYATNNYGYVDELCRIMRPTARSAVMEFGYGQVSEKIQTAFEKKTEDRFEIVHWCGPNPDYVPSARLGVRSMQTLSVYVEAAQKKVVRKEYFRSWPFMVPRWDVWSNETYGRGIGEIALADTLSAQQIRRTNLTAGERAANPTLLATDEQSMRQAVRAIPGSTIYGGMGLDGKRRVEVLHEGKNLAISLEMEREIRNGIKDAFLFSLMQIQGSTDMTATEFLGRQQERWRLLGPHLGRLESEFLTPLIRRRFQMLLEAGQILPPPEEIAGRPLQIRYISQAAKLQRVAEAESAIQTATAMVNLAAVKPEVMDRLDVNAFAEALDRGYGSNIILSREEAQAIAEARTQQQQQQAMLEAAPGLGRATRDVAAAQRLANAPTAAA